MGVSQARDGSLIKRDVSEFPLAFGVFRDGVAVAVELVLVGCQSLQPHRPARMQLACADSDLSAEAIARRLP